MIPRLLAPRLLRLAEQYPVLTLTGPRQSGKTTLVRELFKDKPYVSLEDLDTRAFARQDPRGFLSRNPEGAVLDEIQRVPELLSYIQDFIDREDRKGMFVLTGSQNFALMESLSQSLAGRSALMELHPLALAELSIHAPLEDPWSVIVRGFYPRVIADRLDPAEAYASYLRTYVERDLRSLAAIKDLGRFETFLALCAGRTGQLLNLSSLAADSGISVNTAKDWLSLFEASSVVFLLRPWQANVGKRLVKSPKLHFVDTGLACALLTITDARTLSTHPLRGQLFETMVVADILKRRTALGLPGRLSFFRDSAGHEIDFLVESGEGIDQVEIKSGSTVAEDFLRTLEWTAPLLPRLRSSTLIYGGGESYIRKGIGVMGWKGLAAMDRPL